MESRAREGYHEVHELLLTLPLVAVSVAPEAFTHEEPFHLAKKISSLPGVLSVHATHGLPEESSWREELAELPEFWLTLAFVPLYDCPAAFTHSGTASGTATEGLPCGGSTRQERAQSTDTSSLNCFILTILLFGKPKNTIFQKASFLIKSF